MGTINTGSAVPKLGVQQASCRRYQCIIQLPQYYSQVKMGNIYQTFRDSQATSHTMSIKVGIDCAANFL
jgi:hypothetical protein